MEQKRNMILRGTENFSRGELDNVALEDGAIVLDEVAGRHVLYGCYTGPALALSPFSSLNVSWNADTPHGTVVEAQCRVLAGDEWSGWKSMGKWSPEFPRKSTRLAGGGQQIFVLGDTVAVGVPGGGTAVQLRMYLYTDDEKATPSVRLLAVAARPLQWDKQAGQPVNRQLYLPEYAAADHPTAMGGSMALPLILAALVNRYGADILPEEFAYGMSDGATGDCSNAAYAAAIAGCCGYECYQAWMDLRELRAEVRNGYSLAVELEQGSGSRGGTTGWVGLRGFGHDDAVRADFVQLNDPGACHGAVSRTMALSDFNRYFTGRALVLHPRPHGVWGSRPLRRCCTLKPAEAPGTYTFECRGVPVPLAEPFGGWLACAPRSENACATTAGRMFIPILQAGPGVSLPPALCTPGARYTVFAVDTAGAMLVAELQLPATLPPDPCAAAKTQAAAADTKGEA